jgi:hypothetical protein
MGTNVNVVLLGVLTVFFLPSADAAAQQPAGSPAMTPPEQQAPRDTTPGVQPSPPAEADADQTTQDLRTVMQSERRDLVNQLMRLTPEEHERFWPVYNQYRADMMRVNNRLFVLIRDFADNFDTLTDAKAQSLLNENLSIEDAAHRVKTAYVDRFARVLPPKKVARFYQIDNKIDTLFRAEMAKEIPLVR